MMRALAIALLRPRIGGDPHPSFSTPGLWLALAAMLALRVVSEFVGVLHYVFIALWFYCMSTC